MAASSGRGRRTARRLAPIALEAWRRWQALSPEEKERYRALVRRYAERGRGVGRTAYERFGRRGAGGPPQAPRP
jgi:hypothetical protein